MPAHRPTVYTLVVRTQVIYILIEIYDLDIDFDQPTTVCTNWAILEPLLPDKHQRI